LALTLKGNAGIALAPPRMRRPGCSITAQNHSSKLTIGKLWMMKLSATPVVANG
jgi:hypothetical protein